MAVRSKEALKALFETGDTPNGDAFADLIDSFLDADFDNWPDILPAASAKNLTEIAAQVTVSEWVDISQSVGFVDSDTVVITTNLTSLFLPGRRVRANLDSGFVYSEVLSRSYDSGSNTTTVNLKDAVVDSTISDIDYGVFTPVADGGAVGLGVLGVTAFAASLLDDAAASDARVTLGYSAGKHEFAKTVPPGVNDDTAAGYSVGSWWFNILEGHTYVCRNATNGAAKWDILGDRPGQIIAFAGTGTPDGYAECNGQNLVRADYPTLFAAIGTTWGAGDGSTTFTLPDARRRALVGKGGTGTGTLGNAVGNTGGAETVSHTHTMANHTHSADGTLAATVVQSATISGAAGTPFAGPQTADVTGSTGGPSNNTTEPTAPSVIQPSAVVGYFIKL